MAYYCVTCGEPLSLTDQGETCQYCNSNNQDEFEEHGFSIVDEDWL